MGRTGGSSVKKFVTMEKANEYVADKEEQNDRDVENYEGDRTDSGRGNAYEDDGGFSSFHVIRARKKFCSEQEAQMELSKMAEKADGNDDSIVYVIGEFNTLDPHNDKINKEEAEKFVKELRNYMEIPGNDESSFNVGSDPRFIECRSCHSKLAREHLVNLKHPGGVGACPICDYTAPDLDKSDQVVYEYEWSALSGRSVNDFWCNTNNGGLCLKRPRPLFNEDHEKECKERFIQGKQLIESFKKRKNELDSQPSAGTNVMVASHWTSAHF